MATNKKRGLTRRAFLLRSGIAAAGVAVPARKPLYAAAVQPSRNQILILAGRETNSFGTHGRTDTEQQVVLDAGLAGQNPATLERFPWLVESEPQRRTHGVRVPRRSREPHRRADPGGDHRRLEKARHPVQGQQYASTTAQFRRIP